MAKRPTRNRQPRQPGDKPNPKLCTHRSVVQWPETTYGSCTACGTAMQRSYVGGKDFWQPVPERKPQKSAATDTQPALFAADQLPPQRWELRWKQGEQESQKEGAR